MQRAVAYGLDSEQPFFCGLGSVLQQKRQLLERQLSEIGFKVLPADGTYFLVANFEGLLPEGSSEDDVEASVGWCWVCPGGFAKMMPRCVGACRALGNTSCCCPCMCSLQRKLNALPPPRNL